MSLEAPMYQVLGSIKSLKQLGSSEWFPNPPRGVLIHPSSECSFAWCVAPITVLASIFSVVKSPCPLIGESLIVR
ncbi:uncharacterized protein METZ01_LOCUS65594 [marine metagenome]|uniref:Uncharacterized protein n=1 Tax=marine metagenome TaxID=408172 RepID=A0A381T979_9ZZZZ